MKSLNLFESTNDPDNILVKLLKYENSKVEGFNPEINWEFYHETMTKLGGSQYNCKDKQFLDVINDFNAYLLYNESFVVSYNVRKKKP